MTSDVTVRRLNDAIQALDRATFDEYLHPACRLYCNGEEEACSADGYCEVVEAFRIGFPDLAHETLELIDAGNRVTELFQVTGTHLGLFQGVAPTGRRVSCTGTAVFTSTRTGSSRTTRSSTFYRSCSRSAPFQPTLTQTPETHARSQPLRTAFHATVPLRGTP